MLVVFVFLDDSPSDLFNKKRCLHRLFLGVFMFEHDLLHLFGEFRTLIK